MNYEKLGQDAKKGGFPWAVRRQLPGLEVNDAGTHEKLNRLVSMRQRYIREVMRNHGVGFSEAEKIVDAEPH